MLGIETTFDDTGIALVRGDGTVLGEAVSSQRRLNSQFGGTVPSLAAEAHRARFRGVLADALADAGATLADVDAVAVAVGPGLSACLRVGGDLANGLAAAAGLPLYAVNHLEAHLLTARLTEQPPPTFPFVSLLVTGGNTQVILAEAFGRYTLLGQTLDDAIGEAFDKTARTLGVDLAAGSGGAGVETLAAAATAPATSAIRFSIPMKSHDSMDFSFSGLKTALATRAATEAAAAGVDAPAALPLATRAGLAAAFQDAAFGHVLDKTKRALAHARAQLALPDDAPPLPLVLCGGVSANAALRVELEAATADAGATLVTTPLRLCTDNGVMIAWAGLEHMAAGTEPVDHVVTDPRLVLTHASFSTKP
ncbi:O-sialoglycoprotein endopeptidase [Thecamonas trahens ATCC 50062]|uniref:N(6)-L-threonylcarbamoyladenine synthase n=1 Tax=Thecamonas trahens ATCC 50062 TaxID=461836 RepID=A0A0L0DPL1_THETB|nr:O-sialoglycoprotein endopeptidase [Thecamonas trahens ATCC 50062]KNC54195.1 O-sialoglycoprotein endopeptidase [Thecamonas trahens ATCC 50062]|eukprot:XP_013753836.1 O-sialoglycoprotein endopeptidase [Thecamonas trahens ATCC 50062]